MQRRLGHLSVQLYDTKKNTVLFNLITNSSPIVSTTYSNPWIAHDLVDGEPLLRLHTEHALDEIFGRLADVLPFRVGEVVLAGADAGLHTRGNCQAVVAVEWWEATKPAHINDARDQFS